MREASSKHKDLYFKDLSPDMLRTIRKYLFVASGSWETKLTADCSLVIKKRISSTNALSFMQPTVENM